MLVLLRQRRVLVWRVVLGGLSHFASIMAGGVDRLQARNSLAALAQSTTQEQYAGAVSLLKKICGNVQQKPTDPRVRRVKLSNAKVHSRLGQFPGGVDFLRACLWTEDASGRLVAGDQCSARTMAEALALLEDAPHHAAVHAGLQPVVTHFHP